MRPHPRRRGKERHQASALFDDVIAVGLELPQVEAGTSYDGTPVLRLHGCFLAGVPTHPSAEPDSVSVRCEPEDRELLLEDAGDTYYTTDYYRKFPVVLARLQHLDREALRDLLSVSWQLTSLKSKRRTTPGKARGAASQRVGGRAPR